MTASIPYVLTTLIYISLTIFNCHQVRHRCAGPVALNMARGALLIGIVLHALIIACAVYQSGGIIMNGAIIISMTLWLAVLILLLDSIRHRVWGLQILLLPWAAVASIWPLLSDILWPHTDTAKLFSWMHIHLFMAILAYVFFILAVLNAVLMMATLYCLHRGRLMSIFSDVPPLLVIESRQFHYIRTAFFLLTLTLLSGMIFNHEVFLSLSWYEYKIVFALISWLIFLGLLLGRHFFGWRGMMAVWWTFTGFVCLILVSVLTRLMV